VIGKSKLMLFVTILAAIIASPAFAQVFDNAIGTGNALPMVYDSKGVKHRYVFGYYGPFDPPIPRGNNCCSLEAATRLGPGFAH
jgi:hypothetical protein